MTFERIQRRALRGQVRDVTTRAGRCSRDLPYRVRQMRDVRIGRSLSYEKGCDEERNKVSQETRGMGNAQ